MLNYQIINPVIIRILFSVLCLCFAQTTVAAKKPLYPDSLAGGQLLTRTLPTGNSQASLNGGASITIDQTLALQADFTINPVNIPVPLLVQKTGGGGNRSVKADLYINGTGGTLIGSDSTSFNGGGPQTVNLLISNATTYNLSAGDYLTLVLTNIGTGNLRVRQDAAGSSQVLLDTDTVIALDYVGVFSNAWPNTTEYHSYVAGDTVYLRATASDPFGSADISSVDFTVTDPTATQVFTANVITQATPAPVDASTAVIETAYTIPAAPAPDGVWSVDYIANEGSEGTVTATDSVSFGVGTPLLSVKKTASTNYDPVNNSTLPKAISNSRVVYTVEVTNSGYGYVDDNTIMITDVLPSAQATFYFGNPLDPVRFTDGSVPSGVSVNFTAVDDPLDDVQFSNDGCSTFVATPTYDSVTGLDTTTPKINCLLINPKGTFNGSDGVNNPGFTVSFTIQLN
jgi:hypothetical protein